MATRQHPHDPGPHDLVIQTDDFSRLLRVRGPAWRLVELPVGAMGAHGVITKFTPDWARVGYVKVSDAITLRNPRQSGHEIEGRVTIRGKSYSAFTSGGDNPDGGQGAILVRTKS